MTTGRTVLMIAAMGVVLLGLSACATVKGVGRDISSAGQAGEDVINGRK